MTSNRRAPGAAMDGRATAVAAASGEKKNSRRRGGRLRAPLSRPKYLLLLRFSSVSTL